MDFLQQLQWRYATKKFDPAKMISDADLTILTESLRLSPSSFGLQPWHFIVIRNKELKAALKPHTDGQAQAVDASHLVVLCMKTAIDVEHVDRHIRHVVNVRGATEASLQRYRERLLSASLGMSRAAYRPWAANQVYLALGMLLATAAYMGIDACPMEGFDAKAYDKMLDLKAKGLHAVVVVALGYRSADDEKGKTKKVRFDAADVISTIL